MIHHVQSRIWNVKAETESKTRKEAKSPPSSENQYNKVLVLKPYASLARSSELSSIFIHRSTSVFMSSTHGTPNYQIIRKAW